MEFSRKVPSLVELCTQTAIANLRYMGDVGDMDLDLLKDILPHCNIDQLTHIENSTKGRDLSPVTDGLWKRFYEQQFGSESANIVIKRMKQKKVVFKWRLLYEAKLKEREEAQNRMAEKLKQRYAESQAKKQSRQIKICSKVPPSSKRSFWEGSGPGTNLSNVKGNLMKKAKLEYLNSHEAKVHAQIRKNSLQRNSFTSQSIYRSAKPNSFQPRNSASSSRSVKPVARKSRPALSQKDGLKEPLGDRSTHEEVDANELRELTETEKSCCSTDQKIIDSLISLWTDQGEIQEKFPFTNDSDCDASSTRTARASVLLTLSRLAGNGRTASKRRKKKGEEEEEMAISFALLSPSPRFYGSLQVHKKWRAGASSPAVPAEVDLTPLEVAIAKKDSKAVKETLDQLSQIGWAKKWSSQPYVSRRMAAFLFTVVGTTGFLGVIAGQLPGDWGFFVPYLLGSISLIVLAIGSVSPGLLQAAIDGFSSFFPDYQERIARHESAHFLGDLLTGHGLLVAYLIGLPILGYSLDLGKEHVNLVDEKLQELIYSGQLDDKELDRLAVVSMAGLAAEGLKYDKVVGQSADLFTLQRFINRSKPQISKDQQQNLTRWAVLFAGSLLKNNALVHEALMAAMAKKASVLECVQVIETAA
ncbi:hypothetical protein ZIOFF_001878 [Zingiber officinale]|uniref:Elongin-A n=2 Tax=Zingiber officinale TaxID=94328 RepID=A0A8J5IKI1_ZINOF|nr:hypothetical protein ZIOFF_001878 [Zingiber officinale]